VVPDQSLQECEDGPSGSGECSCMAGEEAGQRCSDAKFSLTFGYQNIAIQPANMGELILFCLIWFGI